MMWSGFSLIEFSNGGLLLDLRSGGLFRLNESATSIWSERLGGNSEVEIANALATTYGLSVADARQHVTNTLDLDAQQEKAPLSSEEYIYERSANSYVFSRSGVGILKIDIDTFDIRANRIGALKQIDVLSALLSVSPKLMALRGHLVLHASAVNVNGRVVAFGGSSGAGKTTTARAMVRSGASPFCEDKLIIRTGTDRIDAIADSESSLLKWVREAAIDLWDGRTVSCVDLEQACLNGSLLPMVEIGFVDSHRRNGDTIAAVTMSVLDAASAIFCNSFYGSDESADWRRQLELAGALAKRLVGRALTMPAGIGPLETAAIEYVRKMQAEYFPDAGYRG
jgi:Coenzyme PQQ synthesis protein D (PqqD)